MQRPQRLLARQRGAVAARQQPEAVVQALRDLLDRHRRTRAAASSIASGMPSSRWQISATAAALSSVSRNDGLRRRRAVGEELHGRKLRRSRPRAAPARVRAPPAARSGYVRLAADAQRLAARREDRHAAGRLRSSCRASSAQACTTCSQLSSTSRSAARARTARSASTHRTPGVFLDARAPTRPPAAPAADRATGASSTNHTPSG